jgi:hypothetical protein
MNNLSEAVKKTDLAALLDQHFPDARGHGQLAKRVRCTWRGGQSFSGRLFETKAGQQKIHDFVTWQTYDAYEFLTEIVGISKREAAKTLIRDAGLEEQPHTARQNRLQDPWKFAVLPEFPQDLASWSKAHRMVQQPMISQDLTPQSQTRLEELGRWIADAIREVMAADAANAGTPT